MRKGIRLFNKGRFFESHEVWEGVYTEAEEQHKPFIEGLVQLAAAFRIFSDFGETKGPVRMIYQALIRFENYQPAYLKIRVKELSEAIEAWAKAMEKGAEKSPLPIPKIRQEWLSFFS
jgi:predicted metal-dependent hydrolase